MSILKSILHHYNKTTKSYDTLHPETESAQITDWHSGIMASLASKTLGTVVDAITTDSVLGKLLKMVLTASGVKYNIAQNGYVCLGSFFGGLIIQWGKDETNSSGYGIVTLPVTYPNKIASICFMEEDIHDKNLEHLSYYYLNNDHVEVFGQDASATGIKIIFMYISIGW